MLYHHYKLGYKGVHSRLTETESMLVPYQCGDLQLYKGVHSRLTETMRVYWPRPLSRCTRASIHG